MANETFSATHVNENTSGLRFCLNPFVLIDLQVLIEEKSRASIEVEGTRRHLSESAAVGLRVLSDAIFEELHENIEKKLRTFRRTFRSNPVDGLSRRIEVERHCREEK